MLGLKLKFVWFLLFIYSSMLYIIVQQMKQFMN